MGVVRAGDISILGINGSMRESSCCFLALQHAISLVHGMGCRTRIFDVRRVSLPFCNGNKTDPHHDFPDVARLRRAVSGSHGLILATPEYHGGASGVLKNLLDLLEIEHLEGKVVGCISVLGGQQNCNALNELRQVIRWCHGWVIPEQIAIGRSAEVLANRCFRDAELLERFDEFATSLVRSTQRLADLQDNQELHASPAASPSCPVGCLREAALSTTEPEEYTGHEIRYGRTPFGRRI